MTTVSSDYPDDPIDLDAMLNSYHIPEDAGEFREGLSNILKRIPLNWGRWISCDKGWYPLLVELDGKLSEICSDYEIHQVKEKYATLRYYFEIPNPEPQCIIDAEASRPAPGAINPKYMRMNETRTLDQQYQLSEWFHTKYMPIFDSEEYKKQMEDLEPERLRRQDLYRQMNEIVGEYEDISSRTCEICSESGSIHNQGYWLKTLCPTCAEENHYEKKDSDDE